MKKILFLMILMAFVSQSMFSQNNLVDGNTEHTDKKLIVVTFPDANLEAAVRTALSKPTGDITDTDMLTLTSFTATSKSITNITGLEYAKNLNSLELRFNQISNISALSSLTNLTYVFINNNQISNISALSGLTNLASLDLCYNQISDISILSGLTKMTYLYLQGNQISNISALAGLTNLNTLYLYDNQISNIRLSGLTNLTYLNLNNNQISNISLSGLTNLTQLCLNFNQINDISALSGLANLQELELNNNQISDISGLSGLTNLTSLQLINNQISNISLSGLTNLTSLFLRNNQISNISLSGLTNLTSLLLDNNQISDISALSGLTNLTRLYLNNNQISNITAIYGLIQIQYLHLYNNLLSDEDLPSLYSLKLLQSGLNLTGNLGFTEAAIRALDAQLPLITYEQILWNPLPTFKISGVVSYSTSGLSGATVTLSGGKDSVYTTTGDGSYSFSVNSGGNYTATPTKAGYTFSPTNKSFTNVAVNQTQNFTATPNIPNTPSAPVLSQPADASVNTATNPTLSWNASTGTTSYRLQVSTSNTFATTVFDQSDITGTSQQVTSLSNSTKYYWRVCATNAGGTSAWSSVWSFTTQGAGVYIPVSLPTTTAAPNTTIEVPISVGDLTGQNILAFQFTVAYSNSILTAKSDIGVTGAMSGITGWSVTPNTTTPGQITVGGFGSTPLSGSGTLMKLKFDVIGAQGTSSPLNFSSFIFNSGTPAVTTTNGSISVNQTLICGDASDDGVVNAYDAAKALRQAIGLETLTTQGKLNADVDKDNNITAFDAALILRHSIGLAMPAGVTTTCWGITMMKGSYELPNISFMNELPVISTNDASITLPIKLRSSSREILSLSFDVDLAGQNNISSLSSSNLPKDALYVSNRISGNKYSVGIISGTGINFDDIQMLLKTNNSQNANEITISKINVNSTKIQDVKLFTALGDNTISGFELYGAYPNPFNPSTRIAFNLPNDSKVQIEIYNTLGKKIRELLNDNLNEGKHEVVWDCKDDNNNKVSSGLYYCRMMSGSFTKTIKLSLIK